MTKTIANPSAPHQAGGALCATNVHEQRDEIVRLKNLLAAAQAEVAALKAR